MDGLVEPKRRNLQKTRARIIAAAADVFTSSGYARAGLREIADKADVAVSLLTKYFGTKASLFEHALLKVLDDNTLFTWDKSRFGEEMTAMMAERSSAKITVMLALAMGDPESQEVATRIYNQQMIEPLAAWLGPPSAEARASDLFAVMTGFVIQMHILNGGAVSEHSRTWLAKTLQELVDGKQV